MAKSGNAALFIETRRRFFSPNPFSYDAFDALLGTLQDEFDTQACIAGGWIRDAGLFLARPRDIDVFFEADMENLPDLERTPSRLSTNFEELNPDYNWAGNLSMQSVRTMEFDGEKWPVNLIFLDPSKTITADKGFWVDHVIRSFDMGLCQVGYSIQHGMRCTVAFDEAVRHKEITLNPNVKHYRIAERVAKMAAKYPTWYIPDEDQVRAATAETL